MLLGPVFRAELVRTPRRVRYYTLRVLYGLALLFLLWVNYQNLLVMAAIRGGRPRIDDFSRFALATFTWFGFVQLGTLLILIPPLFGSVIADEKQRKTLHYLMASQLSSGEIIVDKMAARMLHVGGFVLLGLPVMSILTLFGGVAWDYVVATYLATCSTAFFAASLCILISTFARRVRQAVLVAYVAIIAWLFVPPFADSILSWLYPNFHQWFMPVNDWIEITSPLGMWTMYLTRAPRAFLGRGLTGPGFGLTAPGFIELYLWMVGLQIGVGLLFILIAARVLRPTFRRQEESQPRLTWFSPRGRRPRWLRRPECGSDAMLWKERHFARTDVFTKLVLLPATIILTVCVILGGGFDEKVLDAFANVWRNGYSASSSGSLPLNRILCAISPIYITLWLLAAAGAAASSVTFERERDSWDSLLATPLSGWQIVRGKTVGAMWGLRGFGGILSLFWIVGLLAGAIHPLGLSLALFIVAVLTWFVLALGTHASLTGKTTARALTGTIAILIGLNFGYLGVLYPILLVLHAAEEFHYPFAACTPWTASHSLLSYPQVAQLAEFLRDFSQPSGIDWRGVGYAGLVLLGYAFGAILLTWRSVRRFDLAVDRPRRSSP